MAYFSKTDKANVEPAVKAVLKEYNVKGRLSGANGFSAVVKLNSGAIDFIGNYNKVCGQRDYDGRSIVAKDRLSVNQYWYKEHFDGIAEKFLSDLIAAMKGKDWHNNTDISTDYFDISYYIDIEVGAWDKPYIVTESV